MHQKFDSRENSTMVACAVDYCNSFKACNTLQNISLSLDMAERPERGGGGEGGPCTTAFSKFSSTFKKIKLHRYIIYHG